MWSTLTIDVSAQSVTRSPFDEDFGFLGGRGLIADYLIKKVPPTCDPLGPENRLIFCLGMFAGTSFTTAHRIFVGGKSPLTGGVKESDAGGYIGTLMARQGVKLIEVIGKPAEDKLCLLYIDADGNAELLDASEYHLMDNYEFVEKMYERFGTSIASMSIGSAGERLYKASSIQVSESGEHPSRAAGRGGLAALMGSKGLKAVVIAKPKVNFKPQMADAAAFKENCLIVNKQVAETSKTNPFHTIGTHSTIEVTRKNGVLPVKNFSGRISPEAVEVGAEPFMANMATRGGGNMKACQPGCLVQCSNVYNSPDGKYVTSGFEYETIALFGPNCGIYDLDAIAKMDRLCDDVGVDTIDIATALAVAMDCGKIEFGDIDGAFALLKDMANGVGFGLTLGNGCEAVGLELGSTRIPVVKHQALSAYDPRNTKGTGITYAMSPQGADHTAGLTMGFTPDDMGRPTQAVASKTLQTAIAASDSMMCLFALSGCLPVLPQLINMINALYGVELTEDDFGKIGATCILTERHFNALAGFTSKDDRLPEFFYKERATGTGSAFDLPDLDVDRVFTY